MCGETGQRLKILQPTSVGLGFKNLLNSRGFEPSTTRGLGDSSSVSLGSIPDLVFIFTFGGLHADDFMHGPDKKSEHWYDHQL